MKKLILLALLSGIAYQNTNAQSSNVYQDDIYYKTDDARNDAKKRAKQQQQNSSNQYNDANHYDAYDENNYDDPNQYNNNSAYIDYDDDDNYRYATYFNRFGSGNFYTRPYFSIFSNPYWYNPYWVDPYWGWSPWYSGSGISIGFGVGPYWNSYWGWQNWYGYGGFNSYYYYPTYSFGWGWGRPWMMNYGCGYYGSYWNGYYAGLYGGYGWNNYNHNNYYNRNVTYGPRYSMSNLANNTHRNAALPNGGFSNTGRFRQSNPMNGIGNTSTRYNNNYRENAARSNMGNPAATNVYSNGNSGRMNRDENAAINSSTNRGWGRQDRTINTDPYQNRNNANEAAWGRPSRAERRSGAMMGGDNNIQNRANNFGADRPMRQGNSFGNDNPMRGNFEGQRNMGAPSRAFQNSAPSVPSYRGGGNNFGGSRSFGNGGGSMGGSRSMGGGSVGGGMRGGGGRR